MSAIFCFTTKTTQPCPRYSRYRCLNLKGALTQRGWGGGGWGGTTIYYYIYDPPIDPIYDITSGCRVAALFSREAQRWTPDTIWVPRYFHPQANGIMYLECREC